jgi:hypothetical protein
MRKFLGNRRATIVTKVLTSTGGLTVLAAVLAAPKKW